MAGQETVMGLDSETYDASASQYAKGKIYSWMIAGIIYAIIVGQHVLLVSLLLFLPGIFVISMLSIPFFFLKVQKYKVLPGTRNVFVLTFFTLTTLIDLIFPIFFAVIGVKILVAMLPA